MTNNNSQLKKKNSKVIIKFDRYTIDEVNFFKNNISIKKLEFDLTDEARKGICKSVNPHIAFYKKVGDTLFFFHCMLQTKEIKNNNFIFKCFKVA